MLPTLPDMISEVSFSWWYPSPGDSEHIPYDFVLKVPYAAKNYLTFMLISTELILFMLCVNSLTTAHEAKNPWNTLPTCQPKMSSIRMAGLFTSSRERWSNLETKMIRAGLASD